jgi:hypothetical protein
MQAAGPGLSGRFTPISQLARDDALQETSLIFIPNEQPFGRNVADRRAISVMRSDWEVQPRIRLGQSQKPPGVHINIAEIDITVLIGIQEALEHGIAP